MAAEPLADQVITKINRTVGRISWGVQIVVALIASALILAAMAPAIGVVVPYVKMLSWTEIAYAMGAYYLFRKA